jgi:hypothetical protein
VTKILDRELPKNISVVVGDDQVAALTGDRRPATADSGRQT